MRGIDETLLWSEPLILAAYIKTSEKSISESGLWLGLIGQMIVEKDVVTSLLFNCSLRSFSKSCS